MNSFDYIVVGAGSSGCVVAARLAEDPAVSVLVIEAGGSEKKPIMQMPLAWFNAMRSPALNWGYMTEPEPFADDRRIPAPRGRVVGGCSSINGMMYSRGSPHDYDQWSQMGARGWSFEEVLPYFRRSEKNWRGESAHHGGQGPLTVARHVADDTLYPAVIEAASALGYHQIDDFHGDEQEGFSVPDFTVHQGRRGSTAARFLRPALTRPNIQLVTEALTTRVIVEGTRVVGIEYLRDGKREVVRANREVILSAGAFNSPHLLLLSGIGPAEELREQGIEVVRDLPGVGRNLQEHASVGLIFEAAVDTFDRELRLDRMILSVLRWQLSGTGPVAGLPVGAQGFLRTREGLDRPDDQLLISPVAMDAGLWFPGWRKRRGDFFSVSNVLLHPESRGTVTLRSADPREKPKILFNLLQAEADRASFRRFIRFTRQLFEQPALARITRREVIPGPAVESDEAIDAYVRKGIGTAMHPTSSCAMGAGPTAVVDEALRVHGLSGLRVVDCSIMPTIVGGNTNAPAIMIAEKAADLIKADRGEALAA